MHIQKIDPGSPAPTELPHVKFSGAAAWPHAGTSSAARPRAGQTAEQGELAQLLGQLRAEPELRADQLERVRVQLLQGDYFTRAAAEATAAQMLGTEG